MKIELKDFQEDVAGELIDQLDSARYEAARGKPQAISLASPTGSGKTVVATAVIERILQGDENHAADPDATFLWLTDQPELNEQTYNKMLDTSSFLTRTRLEIINGTFKAERFRPGVVYFLNTQKLGRNSTLIRKGDGRTHTLWETIANTVGEQPTNFYVVIDEAHRGMQEGRERETADTIIQKFIKGSEGEIPAIPMLFAISATIERFDEVVARTNRVKRPVEVPIDSVRASGLLKDAINLFHPDESQPSDITMLREAARSWKRYRERWKKYAKGSGEEAVEPVLLIQVQDASGKQISATKLSEVITALRDELGSLPSEAVAHAFQEGAPVPLDDLSIRYLAPSAIDADDKVRVVLFKTSLNTGWDCPRAEVMMSFRKAADDTSIAQLVGRMVRAPLARRVDADEHLNTVALYLPHYDRKGLNKVIKRLEADDPTNMPPTEVREGKAVVSLSRAPRSAKVFEQLEGLPTYVIPRARPTSQVRRLGKLGSLLSRYGIDERAPDAETKQLVDVLLAELRARSRTSAFKKIVKDSGVLEVRAVEWRFEPDALPESTVELPISEENVNDLFAWAGRRLGEGLHKAYWKARAANGARNHRKTKLEAYALAAEPDVVTKVEKKAQQRVQALLTKHAVAIAKQSDAARQGFDDVRALAVDPELSEPAYPQDLEVPEGPDSFERHLYVSEDGAFSFKATSWEKITLGEELGRKDLVGWMRNTDRKAYSICVPYEMGGVYKGCYPDFLTARKVGRRLVIDIVDPHLLDFEDAWHRAQGLAKYAAKHADKFGRIEMIRVNDGRTERLDLVDEEIRERVLKVSSNDHLRELFDK